MRPSLSIDKATLIQLCVKHHICRLALFGSQLKGTANPESDIDLLVEFDTEHVPGLLGIVGMEIKLSEMLGRKADLRTVGAGRDTFVTRLNERLKCNIPPEDPIRDTG